MTVFRKWHDCIHFRDPDKVISREQRLDVSRAIRSQPRTVQEMMQYSQEEVEERGLVWEITDVVAPDDQFEAMEVNDVGHVTIWTRDFVCGIVRDGQTERMRAFPRHPPTSQ